MAYTLNLLNGSLLSQNAPSPSCSLPTAAPYIVHFPHGPTTAVDLAGLHELFVACPTGNLLVVNDTTGALEATIPVGLNPSAMQEKESGGVPLVYVANSGSNNVSVISAATHRVVRTIRTPTGSNPAGLAVGPGKTRLYVTDEGLDEVSVYYPSNGTRAATIPVASSPTGIAYDDFNGNLYVANSGSDVVSVISVLTSSVVASVGVGSAPVGVAVSNSNGDVFVTNQNSSDVSVISPSEPLVIATIPVGTAPVGLSYSSPDNALYVADSGSNAVSVVNAGSLSVSATIPVGLRPLATTPGSGTVFTVNSATYNLSRISTSSRSVMGTLAIAVAPRGMAYDPTSQLLFVPLGGNDSVAVINTTTHWLIATLTTGLEPSLATYDAFNGMVYVDNHEGNTISVIDGRTARLVTTIATQDGPTSMVVDPVSKELYVGIGHLGFVSVFNTTTYNETAEIPVGNTPYGMIYVPVDGGRLFVTNYRSGNLSVIDPTTDTVTGNYAVAPGPTLMAYDAANGLVYISSFVNGSLYRFNTTTDRLLPGSIPVGTSPMGVLSRGFGNLVYVTNYGSGNLTLVDPATGTAVGSVAVGPEPIAAALLPNGEMYVTDAGGSSISILSDHTLTGVGLTSGVSRVALGASTVIAAHPECALGPCPTSVEYRWSISAAGSFLNSTRGASVTLFAGNHTQSNVTVSVTATLGPANESRSILLAVGEPSSSPTLFGLPLGAAYAVIGSVAVAVVAVGGAIAYGMRARRRQPPPTPIPSDPTRSPP